MVMSENVDTQGPSQRRLSRPLRKLRRPRHTIVQDNLTTCGYEMVDDTKKWNKVEIPNHHQKIGQQLNTTKTIQ